MTHEDFLKRIEGYYGPYERKEQKGEIYKYLKQKVPERWLDILYGRVLLREEARYKYVPGISCFTKCSMELYEEGGFWEKKITLLTDYTGLTEKEREQCKIELKKLLEKLRGKEVAL